MATLRFATCTVWQDDAYLHHWRTAAVALGGGRSSAARVRSWSGDGRAADRPVITESANACQCNIASMRRATSYRDAHISRVPTRTRGCVCVRVRVSRPRSRGRLLGSCRSFASCLLGRVPHDRNCNWPFRTVGIGLTDDRDHEVICADARARNHGTAQRRAAWRPSLPASTGLRTERRCRTYIYTRRASESCLPGRPKRKARYCIERVCHICICSGRGASFAFHRPAE